MTPKSPVISRSGFSLCLTQFMSMWRKCRLYLLQFSPSAEGLPHAYPHSPGIPSGLGLLLLLLFLLFRIGAPNGGGPHRREKSKSTSASLHLWITRTHQRVSLTFWCSVVLEDFFPFKALDPPPPSFPRRDTAETELNQKKKPRSSSSSFPLFFG